MYVECINLCTIVYMYMYACSMYKIYVYMYACRGAGIYACMLVYMFSVVSMFSGCSSTLDRDLTYV